MKSQLLELAKPPLAPVERRGRLGIIQNAAHQGANSLFSLPEFSLAIVEFDDQGRCYDRRQMHCLIGKLEELKARDAIVIVFTHGWKHDARSNDNNLQNFCTLLSEVATFPGAHGVPILGIFAGWRGMSLYGFGLDNLTVWDRQQAGYRVAQGAPRELFVRLHRWRAITQQVGGEPLLVIIGHSFGGLITFAALAQSLIETAATQSGEIVPSYADLVLLVNPAFEGERYLPIHDLVKERAEGSFARNQRPVFVSVTAHNDWATGIFFPIGNFYRRFEESALGREEKQALIRTMGHIEWMRTHELGSAHPPGEAPEDRHFVGSALPRPIHSGLSVPLRRWSTATTVSGKSRLSRLSRISSRNTCRRHMLAG